jgi:hypothetical protein
VAVSRAQLFPVLRSDPIEAYHEIGRDAGRMFKGAAPAICRCSGRKTLELTIHLNVAAMPPDRGEICLPQFIRSPE